MLLLWLGVCIQDFSSNPEEGKNFQVTVDCSALTIADALLSKQRDIYYLTMTCHLYNL